MINHFAQNLRKLRDRRGISRQRLAMNFDGVSRDNVLTWERGSQPTFNVLIKLADYFGITVDDFLREEL